MSETKDIAKKQVIIIGAGPAGLSAAHELLSRAPQDYEVTVLEEAKEVGGISRTVCHNNLRMDIGGHRFFSKELRVNRWWHERMPLQGAPAFDDIVLLRNPKLNEVGPDPAKTDRVMLHRQRLSHIYYEQEFFDYPIVLSKKTLAQFGVKRMLQVIASYLKARMHKLDETNLENFYINHFGKKLYSMFFESYTEKLWGKHPSQIGADWGAQRVKGLSISVLLKNALKLAKKNKGVKGADKNKGVRSAGDCAGSEAQGSENVSGSIGVAATEEEKSAGRCTGDTVAQAVKNAGGFGGELVTDAKQETSLISEFEYPKLGPGQMWEQTAEEIRKMGGSFEFGKKVVQINSAGLDVDALLDSAPLPDSTQASASESPSNSVQFHAVEVICADGSKYKADYVFSSMPLSDLVNATQNAPSEVKSIAANLPYRDFITVGLLVKKLAVSNIDGKGASAVHGLGGIIADNWIYVQDGDVAVGRVQIFNNWSPYMLPNPDKQVWLGLEYFCNEGDDLFSLSDEELIERAKKELAKIGIIAESEPVLDAHVVRIPKAYPAYFGSYNSIDKIVEWANEQPWLFCIGRNGQHRYNNMDHSMMTAFLAVDCLLAGKTDRSAVWQVNAEAHYHEEADK